MADPMPSRGRSIALVVSLCLNLALIALIAVMLSRAVGAGFIAQPGGQLAPAMIMAGLSAERQDKIRGIMDEHADAMLEAQQRARRVRMAVFRSFAAPDYSPGGFANALEQVRAADGTLEEEAILRLKDIINSLTPDERKTIVARVRSGANRLPWWRRLLNRTGL